MDVNESRLQFESSKENLIQTILKNSSDLDSGMIAEAIREFVRSHERYIMEKKRALDWISGP